MSLLLNESSWNTLLTFLVSSSIKWILWDNVLYFWYVRLPTAGSTKTTLDFLSDPVRIGILFLLYHNPMVCSFDGFFHDIIWGLKIFCLMGCTCKWGKRLLSPNLISREVTINHFHLSRILVIYQKKGFWEVYNVVPGVKRNGFWWDIVPC